jgi:hypothetical protein
MLTHHPKTKGGKNQYKVVATWNANDGFSYNGTITILVLNKNGGKAFVTPIPIKKTVMSVDFGPQMNVPAGTYVVYVIVDYVDNNTKRTSSANNAGFEITVTN